MRQHGDTRRRGGFSLIETLITVAVIVAIAALAGVSIMALPDVNRLTMAGDDLRGLLSGLRTRAMDDGQPWEFNFAADGRGYRVRGLGDKQAATPQQPLGKEQETEPQQKSTRDPYSPDNHIPFDAPEAVGVRNLPEGLTFRTATDISGGISADYGGVKAMGSLADLPADGTTIRFLPDGTCNTAAFLVEETGGAKLRIIVRGLTGAVTVERLKADGQPIRGTP